MENSFKLLCSTVKCIMGIIFGCEFTFYYIYLCSADCLSVCLGKRCRLNFVKSIWVEMDFR